MGRAETLSSVFFLAAFIFYTKSTRRKKSTGKSQAKSINKVYSTSYLYNDLVDDVDGSKSVIFRH